MPSAIPLQEARRRLLELLAPVVVEAGFELDDVNVQHIGRRSVVRVIVDADGGVDLDGIATVSRVVSEAIDADTPGGSTFAGPYVLEVSSPGVDRPLTDERHWRRATGRLVQVTADGLPLTGRVQAVGAEGVRLTVDGTDRELNWSDLGPGRVQVEFNRPGRVDRLDKDEIGEIGEIKGEVG